jgi:hypothetical protein
MSASLAAQVNTRGRTDLEELVEENTGLVDHGKVEWTPVLEEGQVYELVVDGEVVVRRVVVLGDRARAMVATRADLWALARGLCAVEEGRVRRGRGKGGKVQPARERLSPHATRSTDTVSTRRSSKQQRGSQYGAIGCGRGDRVRVRGLTRFFDETTDAGLEGSARTGAGESRT